MKSKKTIYSQRKKQDKLYIIPISAKSRQSLEYYKQALLEYLTEANTNTPSFSIQDIAYTLQEKREHFTYRSAYCAKNTDELINKLIWDSSFGEANAEDNNKVVFMFPGQGVQYTHMAKELYDREPLFKATIDQCIALANPHLDADLYEVIYPKKEPSLYNINEIQWTPISLFILEYALAKYLEHLGVKADAYIGHSFGEYVAATLSGVLSVEDAIKVVIARGKLMQAMQPGRMLAINAREETISAILKEQDCDIAVINSIDDIVASGNEKAIDTLQEMLDKQNIPTVKINSSVAGHSKMMERAAKEFKSVFKDIKLHKPTKKFISNLSGEIAQEEVTGATYWCEQLRNTVQFAKGINNLSKLYNHQVSFIEVGPGKGLSYFVNKHKNASSYKSIQTVQLLPSAKEIKSEDQTYQRIVYKEDIKARLWMSGIIRKPNETRLFKRKELTKNGLVHILEKLITPDKEKPFNDNISKDVKILEANYTETEYQIAQLVGEILCTEQVSIHDDFFKIGGNSILAIQLSHRMSKALGCDVKVADIFKFKSISQILPHSLGKIQVNIPKTESTQAILSFAQERLWFIEQYEQGTNAYHIPAIYELDANTDIESIKYALRQIVSRHEVLRSTIEQGYNQEQGIQKVHDAPLFIEETTISNKEDYKSIIKEDINRPFDLNTEYPIRAKFYAIQVDKKEAADHPANKILLLINTHHIASDGWSIDILQKELFTYYQACSNGNADFSLPPLEIQYKDYAIWQKAYLTEEVIEKQLHYWKNKLSGYQTLDLPTDYVRPNQINYRGAVQEFILNKEIGQKLRALAQRLGSTLHSVLLSSINILLSKYTGQDDIVTGSPIANRHHRQTEGMIGFFVNTQANRTLLGKSQSFIDLIQQVQEQQVEAQMHQDLPFEKLVDKLNVERDPSRHPVFQVMFSVQSFGNQRKASEQQKKYLKLLRTEEFYEVAKFDLTIFIDDSQEELIGKISYATSLFHKDTIERFIFHYTHLLDQLVKTPDQPYSRICLLRPEEYNQIIYEWNTTDKTYPKDKTIYQLFQEQVEKTPHHIALVYEEQQLTYKELNEKSNQLARHIRKQYKQRTKQSLAPDTLIALYLDRSLEMVVGILGVLKAGGAYVPMDPSYPQERIDYILHDTNAGLVLSQRQLIESSKNHLPQDKVIHIDLKDDLYNTEESTNLPRHRKASDLAYIIYTSGTTGKPKGVMVEHISFSQFIYNFNEYLSDKINSIERNIICLTNYVFDIFGLEYALPLITGNKVTLASIDSIKEYYFSTHQIIQQTPSALLHLATQYSDKLFSLTCLVGGEALPPFIAEELIKKFHHVINVYGPAETVIWSSAYEIQDYNKPYIGKALFNEQMYVLDPNNKPVPVGAIGELYIGGAGLARGYLNRPDLTEERFVPNPFATEADKAKGYTRLYKTGDLVKWLPDGNIEYIGRNDEQVKIHGYRIELGEIESAILQIAGIKQCCVLAKERKTETGNTKYLVGYYVLGNKDDTLNQITILDKLTHVLPEYMVPGALIEMNSFPLTINGKLDKRALPDPDFKSSSYEYIAPTNETEAALCKIWQKILGLDKVGIRDDFFRIGGNSILAIQVSHRMSKALVCDIKVADIFKYKTISQLLVHSLGETQVSIPKTDTKQAVLSFAQEGLWFIEQYENGTNAYHIPALYELDGDTDIEGIKYALQQVVSRHEVLRSTIEQGDTKEYGLQRVHDAPLTIEEVIITDKDDCKSRIKQDINRPFDLSAAYPIQVKLYIIQSNKAISKDPLDKTLLLINTHHIASDGWSNDIFQKELFAYYEAYSNGHTDFSLPALEIQYKDYAVWQRSYLSGSILEKQLNYWKEKLTGYPTLELPTDYARPSAINYQGSYQSFILSKEISGKLRDLAKAHGATLNSVMLSSINILLGKYTGQDDIIIGSPIANRHHRQTEGLIGFFVNTQANRTLLTPTQSFEELIEQVHQGQIEAQLHQDLPFEKLVNELRVERDTSRHPVFQVMFGVNSFDNQSEFFDQRKNYLRPYQIRDVYEVEKFDLSIFINDCREEFTGYISYSTSLFRKETIIRLIDHYIYLLDQLTQTPEKPYSEIGLLNPKEYNQIINEWNATEKEYSSDKTIYQLFEAQVERTPKNIALVCEGQELTYKELNERSNQLGRHIRAQYKKRTKREFGADTLIALCLDRSLEMVVGILGVLKAGGAYVPMDPSYPQERIDYILKDTQAALILTQSHFAESSNVQLPQSKVIYIELTEKLYKEEENTNLAQHSQSKDMAYIIYTSGTTGRPKGVMIEHGGVINLIEDLVDQYGITSSERFLLFSNYVFDASVEQMYLSLFSGGTLYIMDYKYIIDSNLFVNFIADNMITHLDSTPSYLSSVEPAKLSMVKRLVFGSEFLSKSLFDEFKKTIPTIINAYGPTEATITSIISINSNSLNKATIQNTKVYVLDINKHPVPVGIIGELYIGGAGLARGYLSSSDLTSERFVANPFATETDKLKGYTRLYKTGDLVRWLPDGNLEYIGRNDEQVKIRGYRIELGEIENALIQIEGIKQATILLKERKTESGSTKYLVGYYVLKNSDDRFTPTTILNGLSKVLPEYMVPSALVAMESFPLTINGKLNKRALPDPDFSSSLDEYVAPNSKIEAAICKIWEDVLGLDKVGMIDNFFGQGGNSILAIRVSHRMSEVLKKDVKIADVFKYKTIEQILACCIGKTHTKIPKTNVNQAVLSFGQERLWFIEQYENGTNAYHIPAVYELDKNTDKEGIKYAVQQIVSRHEVLRSTIGRNDNQGYGIQNIHNESLSIEEIYLTDKDDYESLIKKEINRPFNLSKEYPICAKFYTIESVAKNSSNKIFLLINMHHIASDAWSTEIFEKELFSFYEAYINKDANFILPALEIQYKDYAVWQRSYLSGSILEKQLSYWKEKLMGYPTLELPTDYARPSAINYRGAYQSFILSKEISGKLRDLAKAHDVTLNSVLLGSITILLNKYTGQDDIIIGSPIANRHHRQTEELIGFFVNTQASRTLLTPTQSFEELIEQVHQDQIEAQLHQDLPFEKLIDELGVERDTSRHPIFQVMFGLQNFMDQEETLHQQNYLKPYHLAGFYEVEKFDLSIFINDSKEELRVRISYSSSLFHKETIVKIMDHYKYLLGQLTQQSGKPYSKISLLSPEDRRQIIEDWNGSVADYPAATLVDICLADMNKKAAGIAVIDRNGRYSYKKISQYSYHLASLLHEKGLSKKNSLIGILSEKGYQQVVSTLGIMQSGGAYLPLHVDWPIGRIDEILKEGFVKTVLVSQKAFNDFVRGSIIVSKYTWIIIEEGITYQPVVSPQALPRTQPEDIAYVIFTSGSTGNPKGVTISHEGAVNTICAVNDKFKVTSEDKILALSELSFDLSVYDMFGLLAAGGTVVFPDQNKTKEPDHWYSLIKENSITLWDTVPQLMQLLVDYAVDTFQPLNTLKAVLMSGDWIPVKLPESIKKINPDTTVMSLGGATEGSIWSIWYEVKSVKAEWNSIPYGQAMPNQKMYVLNDTKEHCPVGVQGDIYIGGKGVALGYWNDAVKTGASFFTDEQSGRIYKTGDLGRWNKEGYIEFMGRRDDQVKIGGYRIELGEIENALSQIGGIKHYCVLVKERKTALNKIKYLAGYYVLDQGAEEAVTPGIIQSKLSKVLPDYMVPSVFVEIDTLPLSVNGKLDKRALPDPEFRSNDSEYVSPSTEIEKTLCEIWQAVLNMDRVGITDDFFRLGGNSILAIKASHCMSEALEYKVKLANMFKYRTISQLLSYTANQFEITEVEKTKFIF